MGVVVQQRSALDVRVELHARLHIEARVEVHLLLAQLILPDGHLDWRQVEIRFAFLLGPAEHRLAEDIIPKRHEGLLPRAHVAVLDDRVGDRLLEGGIVHEADVPTIRAVPLAHEAQALALAILLLAVIESVRTQAKEPDQRVQLPDTVLERRPCQAPLRDRALQLVGRQCRTVHAALDAVSLIEDDAGPHHRVQRRPRQVLRCPFVGLRGATLLLHLGGFPLRAFAACGSPLGALAGRRSRGRGGAAGRHGAGRAIRRASRGRRCAFLALGRGRLRLRLGLGLGLG
mmetsp:Transcript_135287/g.342319  ORF Transcript_135287/g.342319 Transcript_135287/m.342319 type:complete len:287 (-) Transcript_135287:290-1150(-)